MNDSSGISIFAGFGGIQQNSNVDARNGDLYMEAAGGINPGSVSSAKTITIKSTHLNISGGGLSGSTFGGDFPRKVFLAGFFGISGFNATGARRVEAISANGSITNLGNNANFLRLIAKENIAGIGIVGRAELFAGHDIDVNVPSGGNLLIKAGGDVFLRANKVIFGDLSLTTGQDPFADLGGITIAGVSAPEWTPPPASTGFVTIGNDFNTLVYAFGSVTIDASGNVALPRIHIEQDLDVTAGGQVNVQQFETIGAISITANSLIIINTHIGPIYGLATGGWNPNDLGVASLFLLSNNSAIFFAGARAQGDITIAAPNSFVFSTNGVISEGGGTISVTDADGDVTLPPYVPVFASRFPGLDVVSPVVVPGPTLAGPAAPSLAGALPPGAPAGATVASLSSPGGATLASLSPSGATVTDASASGASLSSPGTGGATVAGTSAPGGATGLSEVFVEDPVVSTLTLSEIIPSDEADEAGDDDGETGQSAAQGEDDDEDDEKDESAAEDEEQAIVVPGGAGTVDNPITYDSFTGVELVFTGGRGQAQTEALQ